MAAPELPGTEAAHRPLPNGYKQPQGNEPSENVWDDTTSTDLKMSGAQQTVPAVLRPGNATLAFGDDDDGNVWDEARKQPNEANDLGPVPDALKPASNNSSTNPFLKRKPVPQPNDVTVESSFARLDLDEADQASNPWQANAPGQHLHPLQTQKPLLDDTENDPWASAHPPPPRANAPAAATSPALMSLPSEDEPTWEDEAGPSHAKAPLHAPPGSAMADELIEDQHVWDDLGSLDTTRGKALDLPSAQQAQIDDWNIIDADPSPSSPPKSPAENEAEAGERPPLPPRGDASRPKWTPSRRPIDSQSETYQIKKISWNDETSSTNPRTSPILVQNKNGPCPLVALVNALTLTTPADMHDTALVHVLRSREQVSLNLLLDAVFDELMSPRRTSSDVDLPDVSDLYAFLQSLCTGMNVNPRFVPTKEMMTAYKRTSLTHLDEADRGDFIPGTFENTMEMSLYATFSIPLIHGWLPSRSDVVYEAFERRGASYEEVQNLLFQQEELEDKLSSPSGLSETEAQLYQDIMTIKMFLSASATQLTPWGINVIAKAMRPGTFAILFRNDHFSTLYCHPRTGRLLSLVTDAGFGSHQDVVWESLADVNGEWTEYLTGDFCVLGGGGSASAGNANGSHSASGGDQWTAAPGQHSQGPEQSEQGPASPNHEQEDRDLALALQLQEEEEQQVRDEQARRRREQMLSEEYIEQQGQRPTPVARGSRGVAPGGRAASVSDGSVRQGPDGRNAGGVGLGIDAARTRPEQQASPPQTQQVRPLVPPRREGVSRQPEGAAADAPPSYAQASKHAAFVPPAGHPSHAGSSQATPRTSSGTHGVPLPAAQRPTGTARGRPVYAGAGSSSGGGHGRDRECSLM